MWGSWSVQLSRNGQRALLGSWGFTPTQLYSSRTCFSLCLGVILCKSLIPTCVSLQPVPALLLHSRWHAPHLLHLHLWQVRGWFTLNCVSFMVSLPLDICKIGPFRHVMCLQMPPEWVLACFHWKRQREVGNYLCLLKKQLGNRFYCTPEVPQWLLLLPRSCLCSPLCCSWLFFIK